MRRSKFEQRITTPEQLLALVRYERDEGALYWLPRDASAFKGSQQYANTWNTKYAGRRCGSLGVNGYRYINGGNGEFFYEHRAILFLENGAWPEEVDHVSGVKNNNHFSNLRDVGRVDNSRNSPRTKSNKSGVTGVFWSASKSQWVAIICMGGKNKHLYSGNSFDKAVARRKAAELTYGFHPNHGRDANAVG